MPPVYCKPPGVPSKATRCDSAKSRGVHRPGVAWLALAVLLVLVPGPAGGAPQRDVAALCNGAQQWDAGWRTAIPAAQADLRERYLAGRCLLEAGDFAGAEEIFAEAESLHGPLRQWWELRLLTALLAQGKYTRADWHLQSLLEGNRSGALLKAVRGQLEQLVAEAAPHAGLARRRLLDTYLRTTSPTPEDYPLLRAQWEMMAGETDAAVRAPVLLGLWQSPRSKAEALAWVDELEAWRGNGGQVPGQAMIQRALRLRTLRLTDRNTQELAAAALEGVAPDQSRRLGHIYVGELLRLRRYQDAVAAANSAAARERFAWSEAEQMALATRVALQRRRLAEARQRIEALERRDPQDEALPGFYLSMAKHYHNREDGPATAAWCERLIAAFPRHGLVGEAYWLPFWLHYRAGDHAQALPYAERALAAGDALAHGEQARMLYWKAQSLHALGLPEARAQTLALLRTGFPSSFYGLLAHRQEVQFSAPHPDEALAPPARQSQIPVPQVEQAWAQPQLRPALFLYSVAEFELAGDLLNEVIAQRMPRAAVTELADLSRYHGQYHLLQRIVANHFLGELRDAPARVALPWMDAYPQAYWDVVLAHARQGGIDPFYALSIMREESHFRPAVESASGALGLMQLMPPTAQQMAKAQRLPYDVTALTTPEGNIPLGVAYLARMISRFDGDLIHATAAYNAGPGNVKRWLRTMGDLPRDVFVESLPFEETRRYVKRVYGTYLIYQELYR